MGGGVGGGRGQLSEAWWRLARGGVHGCVVVRLCCLIRIEQLHGVRPSVFPSPNGPPVVVFTVFRSDEQTAPSNKWAGKFREKETGIRPTRYWIPRSSATATGSGRGVREVPRRQDGRGRRRGRVRGSVCVVGPGGGRSGRRRARAAGGVTGCCGTSGIKAFPTLSLLRTLSQSTTISFGHEHGTLYAG